MTATEPRSAVAPSRANRRAGRRREGTGSVLLTTAAGLVLIIGALCVQSLQLGPEARLAPLTYVGAKGEAVDAGRFTARLDSFSTAKSIQSSGKTIGTDGLFFIINVSAKSSFEPYHLGQPVLLTADGKRFSATDRVDSTLTLSNAWVQPDIWVSGRFFFEVPASALPEARVIIALPAKAGLVESFEPEVEVDLGLDEAAARKLAASPQDVYSTDKK